MNLWDIPQLDTAAVGNPPPIDGKTYSPALDGARLGTLLGKVYELMTDGRWRTLAELSDATGGSEASVSARLRDLRKDKFGGHNIQRKRLDGGLWVYRMEVDA